MATETKCRTCDTTWAVVPSTMKAHPGKRTEAITARVPDDDVFGQSHGTRLVESSHWVPAGPSATLERSRDDASTTYAWACLCGAALTYSEAALYVVACQHGAGDTGMCAKAALRQNPPDDLYVNPRHGVACPCCGHQGTHLVRLGEPTPCGARA